MFEFTSPRKLGSVNSSVLEAESVKFSPFSGELHLELQLATRVKTFSKSINLQQELQPAGTVATYSKSYNRQQKFHYGIRSIDLWGLHMTATTAIPLAVRTGLARSFGTSN